MMVKFVKVKYPIKEDQEHIQGEGGGGEERRNSSGSQKECT